MRRLLPCAALLTLAASASCDPSRRPSPSALSPPFDAAAASHHPADAPAARTVPDAVAESARGSAPCGIQTPAITLAQVPSITLAHAVIPSLDETTMRASVALGDAGAPVVEDCHGNRSATDWSMRFDKAPPAGTVEINARQVLPEGRAAVWLTTGIEGGACAGDNGFFAIVHLDGARVAVDGSSSWRTSCNASGHVRPAKVGTQPVYIASEGFGSGAGRSTWEDVWLLRSGKLEMVLSYDVGRSLQMTGLGLPEMEAKVTVQGASILVDQVWTWPECDGGFCKHPPTRKVQQRYRWNGVSFVHAGPTEDPQPP